jgi:hypothetical protein
MKFQPRLLTAAAVAAIVVSARPAQGLVSLEDGKDHLFVDATVQAAYDTNVFTNAQDRGSLVYQGTLGTEFTRRAGWIGVNVSASLAWARYANFRNQDYVDPKVSAELTKQTGRTTGSLTFSAERVNKADVDVNTRDISWNYNVGLNFQYPVIERYSISGAFAYSRSDYEDQALFVNQATYSGNLYLYYILNEQRDLFIDYRERYTAVDRGVSDLDDSISMGVSGKVYGPFNGSLQAGYQRRTPVSGPVSERVRSNDVTVSGSLTWNINRRMNLTADLSRDFSTTAEAQSIETSKAGLTFQDSFTAKSSGTLEGEVGENRFLGAGPSTSQQDTDRLDQFATLSASYFYTLNQHLKIFATYSYYRNWSTLSFADFPREEMSMGLSSHW